MTKALSINQHKFWEEEHKNLAMYPQLHTNIPSGGVVSFFNWLHEFTDINQTKGLEIGCGKGRNAIWLAKQGVMMFGMDFSKTAILEAENRAKKMNIDDRTGFVLCDLTGSWPFDACRFTFTVDCFTTVDIETLENREFIARETVRVLKPGGFHFVYALSSDDEFYKSMVITNSAKEKNAVIYPISHKFEKYYSRDELIDVYKGLRLIKEKRVKKKVRYGEDDYYGNHFWMIFRKDHI